MAQNEPEGRKSKNFEDLNVFKLGREIVSRVYELTRMPGFSRDFAMTGQIRSAALSILGNIAEGYERGSRKEFAQFLFIAKASCGEVRAYLAAARDQKYIEENDYRLLCNSCKQLGSMLSNFIKYLKEQQAKTKKPEK